MNDNNYITTTHIGVSGFKLYWVRTSDNSEFKCRTAITLFGSFNMDREYLEKTSPFEPNFQDNYIEGKGKTREEAYESMQKEMERTSNSLWM